MDFGSRFDRIDNGQHKTRGVFFRQSDGTNYDTKPLIQGNGWWSTYLGSPLCCCRRVFMAFNCEKCWLMSVCKTISMIRLRNSRKSVFCMLLKMLQSCSCIILENETNKSRIKWRWVNRLSLPFPPILREAPKPRRQDSVDVNLFYEMATWQAGKQRWDLQKHCLKSKEVAAFQWGEQWDAFVQRGNYYSWL